MHATLLVYLIVATYGSQTRGQGKAQASLVFREHIIANDLRGGYHVAVADVNRDGRPDIIALAAGGPDLCLVREPRLGAPRSHFGFAFYDQLRSG